MHRRHTETRSTDEVDRDETKKERGRKSGKDPKYLIRRKHPTQEIVPPVYFCSGVFGFLDPCDLSTGPLSLPSPPVGYVSPYRPGPHETRVYTRKTNNVTTDRLKTFLFGTQVPKKVPRRIPPTDGQVGDLYRVGPSLYFCQSDVPTFRRRTTRTLSGRWDGRETLDSPARSSI